MVIATGIALCLIISGWFVEDGIRLEDKLGEDEATSLLAPKGESLTYATVRGGLIGLMDAVDETPMSVGEVLLSRDKHISRGCRYSSVALRVQSDESERIVLLSSFTTFAQQASGISPGN